MPYKGQKQLVKNPLLTIILFSVILLNALSNKNPQKPYIKKNSNKFMISYCTLSLLYISYAVFFGLYEEISLGFNGNLFIIM